MKHLHALLSMALVIAIGGFACLWIYVAHLHVFPAIKEQYIKPEFKQAIRIAALGDIACSPQATVTENTCHMGRVATAIEKAQPVAILLLGDLQYDRGGTAEFTQVFDPLWANLKPKSYAVPGNHEYGTKDAEGYFGYWNGTAETSISAGQRGRGYYSFNLGDWHMIALNSNCEAVGGCDRSSPQGQWLASDILEHQEMKCTLAFWHHPRFTSGRYKESASTLERSKNFWEQLYDGGAEIILNGHDHLYERFAKQTPSGDIVQSGGLRQFTVGTGGSSLYKLKVPLASQEFATETFGFLQLELGVEEYQWSFIDSNSTVLDSGSSRCTNPYRLTGLY